MKSPSEIRLIMGIKSHRPNPIVIRRGNTDAAEAALPEAALPEVADEEFEVTQYDKDYSFNYIQSRWFRRALYLGEELTITADQLKMICDESHEMGRLRERVLQR